MAAGVWVRAISNEEGNRLLRIVRRTSGSVVTWRRAQMVLLSAQGMDAGRIAEVTFTSPDRVRDPLHDFNADGFEALYPRYGPPCTALTVASNGSAVTRSNRPRPKLSPSWRLLSYRRGPSRDPS